MIYKSGNTLAAAQENYLHPQATADCGCSSTSSGCGNNNFSSTGTNMATQCGANHIAKDNPNYKPPGK